MNSPTRPPRPAPRELQVIRKETVSPDMLRITLGGDEMASFPEDQESAYIKLIFPVDGDIEGKIIRRTYTVRHDRLTPSGREIDVDFVLHGNDTTPTSAGVASSWAQHCNPGDTITVGGPGPKKLLDVSADWFFIAGDMTALPAISVNLALLPKNAQGHAVIEVHSNEDIQDLKKPANMAIDWVINPQPGENDTALYNAVIAKPWCDISQERPSVWAACEFSSMKKLRDYFVKDKAVTKDQLYISSYWKHGLNEDNHKIIKSQDAET